jgi:ATP-dependent Clp protease ATP-binding subunit ClpC
VYIFFVNTILLNLVELARDGQDASFQKLVAGLIAQSAGDTRYLVEFARSQDEMLQRAAIRAACNRHEPDVLAALDELAGIAIPLVRQTLAQVLADAPEWGSDALVERLLDDGDDYTRFDALRAAAVRPALEEKLLGRLSIESRPWVRQRNVHVLDCVPPARRLPILMNALGQDFDPGVQQDCATAVEECLDALNGYPPSVSRPPLSVLAEIQARVRRISATGFPHLSAWLNQRLASDVDVNNLKNFGNVLTLQAEAGELPRAHGVDAVLDQVMKVLRGGSPRASVLVGESGCGKTAVICELTHRLLHDADGPWYVLSMSPAEFMAGTHYTGEWETKVLNLVKAIAAPKRVLLVVPNIEELTSMGVSAKTDASVATALAPHIERGAVAILGESTVEGFRQGLGSNRALRRLFHSIDVSEASLEKTRAIVQMVVEESGVEVPEQVIERLMDLADFYAAGTVQPGRTVGLLRRVLSSSAGREGPLTDRDVLETISSSTGVPVQFLDDDEPLDRAQVRNFFETRVMGQPEAVDAVADLVTLVKAGLTDPNKPFGVLLFVGPTGVGKTELARALAELLFGDPARMVRLDMSEFATYEAYDRLIGQGWRGAQPGILTSAVREKPFAVLLFDEIEKAHPNIYNLCLQVFDAGRLTDSQGRTADFRRTIIILTSNIGQSTTSDRGRVGFGQVAPTDPLAATPPSPDQETTMRELGRWFRPEFLNRIDRIVTFRALPVEIAKKIAQREVRRVLERNGLMRRRLELDVDPNILPILLREGYSPSFGARPLKRTVERLVLLPVAQRIAAGQVPNGSLLRLVANGTRIDIEVLEPEETPVAWSLSRPATPEATSSDRAARLMEQLTKLRSQAAPLSSRKSELLSASGQPGAWDHPTTSRLLLDEVYRLDSILGALDALDKAVRDAGVLYAERSPARLEILESQARHIAFLVGCREPRDLGDAYVCLRLAASHGSVLDGVGMLARMYRALAKRRELDIQVLSDRQGGDPPEDSLAMLVCGAGAYALLAGEAGLHQVARGKKEDRGGRRRPVDREVVRVEVLPAPGVEVAFPPEDLRVEVRSLVRQTGRLLARPKLDVELFHRPSMVSVRAWADVGKQEAVDRLRPLLRARIDAAADPPAGRPPVVRRYTLGPATLVRDLRSGRTTGRLDQVLEGHLDVFLVPPDAERAPGV